MMTHSKTMLLVLVAATLSIVARVAVSEEDYSSLFPHALPGWTAGRIESKTTTDKITMMKRLHASRTYTNARAKEQKIIIRINTFDPFEAALIKDAHEKGDLSRTLKTDRRNYQFDGYKGVELGPEKNPNEIKLLIRDSRIVSILSQNAGPEDMTKYLKAMDFDRIKAFSGPQAEEIYPF